MKALLVLALALASASSFAAEPAEFGIHIGTYHVDRDAGYREINPGVYARKGDYTVGVYANSQYGTSVYGTYRLASLGPVSAHIGLVTGYKRAALVPVAVLEVELVYGFKAVIIPPSPQGDKGGVHFAKGF